MLKFTEVQYKSAGESVLGAVTKKYVAITTDEGWTYEDTADKTDTGILRKKNKNQNEVF